MTRPAKVTPDELEALAAKHGGEIEFSSTTAHLMVWGHEYVADLPITQPVQQALDDIRAGRPDRAFRVLVEATEREAAGWGINAVICASPGMGRLAKAVAA